MARADAKTGRPLSPHISVYRWPITMAMSIAHRVTGGANYFGAVFVAGWLVAAASGPQAFATAQDFFGSILGRVILIGYSWSVLHHMLGGLRHLIWDMLAGLDAPWRNRLAWMTLIGSLVLTAALWLGVYFFIW